MTYINKIRNRLHFQNKNWLCVICGETGSGKSYSALSIAETIAGETNKVHLIFEPLEFFSLLNSGTLKRGDVIIADEFGVAMSNREWQSVQNKLMGLILQTFRHMNLAVIFTVPHLSFIDVQARKLLHCYMETANIDYKTKTASISIYEIDVSSRLDKIYYKHPIMSDEYGRDVKVSHIYIKKANEKILKEYEERKSEFSKNLRLKAEQDVAVALDKKINEKGNQKTGKDYEVFVTKILADKKRYFKKLKTTGKKIVDLEMIKLDFDLPEHKAKIIKKMAQSV